jgi:hypothetical protein
MDLRKRADALGVVEGEREHEHGSIEDGVASDVGLTERGDPRWLLDEIPAAEGGSGRDRHALHEGPSVWDFEQSRWAS